MALSFNATQARVKELALQHIKQTKFCAYDTHTMHQRLEELAQRECTPVSLKQAYAFGKNPSSSIRLLNSQFLHQELPIRIVQRIQELKNFPHGLSETPEIQKVIHWYMQYANDILEFPKPQTLQDDANFTALLSTILLDNTTIPRALSMGVHTFRAGRPGRLPAADQGAGEWARVDLANWRAGRDLDNRLRAFYTARVGLRFLIEQHVLSARRQPPGWAGIIQNECDPVAVAAAAAERASEVCRRHMGAAPPVVVTGAGSGARPTFTYAPAHLDYMLV
eukprot:CAMPEP_0194712672 /NCGR_PEP_ID=MMETSP0296-20130528/4691_1 /TAXON_ID=39354 /ORGANISM="Heterosigma akashiwo, Strain CCMP2393" /LENGTH=278 /DNA_ID=CAMNT_0039611141 /DNA_START=93 /DNA_END=925 /DNA_ORIENTATION=+